MTKEEYISFFERKAKTRWTENPGEVLVFHPQHGLLGYIIDVHYMELLITKMVGEGRYWRRKVADLFQALTSLGVKKVRLWTYRKPEVYIRWLGGEVVGKTTEEGKTLYEIEIEPSTAKRGWDTIGQSKK